MMRCMKEHRLAVDSNIVVAVDTVVAVAVEVEMRMRCDNFVWVNDDRHSLASMLAQSPCSDTQGLVSNIDGRKSLQPMGVCAWERSLANFCNQHACEVA